MFQFPISGIPRKLKILVKPLTRSSTNARVPEMPPGEYKVVELDWVLFIKVTLPLDKYIFFYPANLLLFVPQLHPMVC